MTEQVTLKAAAGVTSRALLRSYTRKANSHGNALKYAEGKGLVFREFNFLGTPASIEALSSYMQSLPQDNTADTSSDIQYHLL